MDCPWEGYTLARTLWHFIVDWWYSSSEWAAQTNINIGKEQIMVTYVMLETRCNYFCTLEALLLNKLIIDLIYYNSKNSIIENAIGETNTLTPMSIITNTLSNPDSIRFYAWLLIIFLSFSMSAIDDLTTLFAMIERLDVHGLNMFNYSIFIGKFVRFILSLYFNGILMYTNFFELV